MGPPDRSKLYADRTVTTVETTATGGIGSSDWRANPTSTGVERHNAPYEKRFEVGNASGDKQRSQDLAAIEAKKNSILASTLTDFNNTKGACFRCKPPNYFHLNPDDDSYNEYYNQKTEVFCSPLLPENTERCSDANTEAECNVCLLYTSDAADE